MDIGKYDEDLKDLRNKIRSRGLLIWGLMISLIISQMVVFRVLGSERTIVAPPKLSKAFWIEQDRISNEYLEQMGGYVAWLILDVTPTTIDWKKDALLTFVAPEAAGAMKIRQDVEAERLKKLNASTYFLIQQLSPNEEKQHVILTGQMRTQINGVNTSTNQKSYVAQFYYKHGRLHLEDFKEYANGQ